MAHILVLADNDERTTLIKRACGDWDAGAGIFAVSTRHVGTLDEATVGACDLAILDHVSAPEPRLQAINHLRALKPDLRVLVTGIPEKTENDRAETIFAYLESGAAGYLSDEQLGTMLGDIITEVQRGGTWIEPEMTIELIQRTVALHDALEMMRPYSAVSGQAEMLTRRQQEVLELLAAGLTNKEIADQLYISVGTVKNHVHRILDVLRASSREQAAQYYQFLQAPSVTA